MYKVGIIGYGKMGQIRHQVISAFEDVQVQSIYDPEIIDTEIEKAQNSDQIIENPEIGQPFAFNLAPESDAWFTLIAHGESPMHPLTGASPWAMTSPIRIDVGGDGWEAPLPPLAGTR